MMKTLGLLNWNKKSAPETVDAEQYQEAFGKFRRLLLEQYRIRLLAKTANRLPINLTAKPSNFGTSPERAELYFNDLTIESDDIASEIAKILDTHRRLLLVGDPGAGKTTILLFAAINILNDASESKLPLILNLATWSEGRDFAEWYAQNIAHTYSLSPVFVQELLRRNAVVPFFDGFDEVAEDARDDCFQKMAAYFGDEKRKQLIVSSRKKEYAAAKADAPVYAEIEVQPLSLAQIKKALSENAESQAADRALLYALEHDRWLAEAVEIPFYLNTASFLFGKGQRTLADFPFKAESTEGRQAEIVEVFVAEQVPEERDRKYLSFLAGKMEEEKFLVFELASMQPGWCGKLWWYCLTVGPVIGLVAGIVAGLVIGLDIGIVKGIIAGLLIGFVCGLIIGLGIGLGGERAANWIGAFFISNIPTFDINVWHWRTFIKFKYWKKKLIYIKLGLFIGLLISIIFNDWVLGGWVFGLAIGLTTVVIEAGSTTTFLLHIPNPYQRFWSIFQHSFWTIPSVLFALLLGIIVESIWGKLLTIEKLILWILNPSVWLIYLLLILALFLFPLVLSKFFEHFSLRLVLYLEGKMPLRVVTFMDRMSEQLIFEDNRRSDKTGKKRRGATWRFRHKILQDYFAGNSA